MAITKKILNHLDQNQIKYEVLSHKKVYTAFDASQTLKVHPKEIAKSLILQVKKDFYMVILGADKNLDFGKIAQKFKVAQKEIKIPTEKVLTNKFKIKPGSAHVFASLYKIPVIIDKSFTNLPSAIFSSGNLQESFKIKLKDYLKIEECEIFAFGKAKKLKIQKANPKKKQKKSKGKEAATKKAVSKAVKKK
jgi:Ala-tRNA(Pro) deacylase